MNKLTIDEIKKVFSQVGSMTQAAVALNVSYSTFKKYAKQYGIFKPSNKVIQKCQICGLEDWQGKPIKLIITLKDKNRKNWRAANKFVLCPNCESQNKSLTS